MKVLIDPDLERAVKKTVEGGEYGSAREVVRQALMSFLRIDKKQSARLRRLQEDVAAGLRDIKDGRVAPFSASSIKKHARKRLASIRET